jgi:transmembrane sensor
MAKRFKNIFDFLEDETFRDYVLSGKFESEWRVWLEKNPNRKELFEKAKVVLEEINKDTTSWEKERKKLQFLKLSQAIRDKKRKSILKVTRMAASFLVLILFGILVYSNLKNTPPQLDNARTENNEWIYKEVPSGKKSRFVLKDGTIVTLNSYSKIWYSDNFGETTREIFLEGEGYFEVATHNTEFKVITGDVETKALGTAFNIRYYEELPKLIQLTKGKVSVSKRGNSNNELYLIPGTEVLFDDADNFTKRSFEIEKALMWREGILYFEDASIDEVLKTLERWYGVNINMDREPKRKILVTAKFKRDYLSNVLHSLAYSFGFEYEINKEEVTITFN